MAEDEEIVRPEQEASQDSPRKIVAEVVDGGYCRILLTPEEHVRCTTATELSQSDVTRGCLGSTMPIIRCCPNSSLHQCSRSSVWVGVGQMSIKELPRMISAALPYLFVPFGGTLACVWTSDTGVEARVLDDDDEHKSVPD